MKTFTLGSIVVEHNRLKGSTTRCKRRCSACGTFNIKKMMRILNSSNDILNDTLFKPVPLPVVWLWGMTGKGYWEPVGRMWPGIIGFHIYTRPVPARYKMVKPIQFTNRLAVASAERAS